MNKVLNESASIFDDDNFNLEAWVPVDEDFKKIVDAYNDVQTNGDSCNFKNSAEMLCTTARPAEIIVKRLIVAILIHWDALKDALLAKWTATFHSKEDLKKLISEIKTQYARLLSDLLALYSENLIKAKTDQDTSAQQTTTNTQSTTSNNTATQNKNIQYGIFMLSAYDAGGARRHFRVGKKVNGVYKVVIDSAQLTSWDNLFVFTDTNMINNFINNIFAGKIKTTRPVNSYKITINNKFYKQMPHQDINNDYVLVDTDCGPAYICKYSQYCVE